VPRGPPATRWQFRQDILVANGRDWAARSGRPQFPSLVIIPSETGQISPHLKGASRLGSTPNLLFRPRCPYFPRPVVSAPDPLYAGVHPTGAPPGHIYRQSEGSPLRGALRGRMVSPSSHRVAFPQQPAPSPSPLLGPDTRKGDLLACPSACFAASPPWIAWRFALAPHHTSSHPVPSRPLPSLPTSHPPHLPNPRTALPDRLSRPPPWGRRNPNLRHSTGATYLRAASKAALALAQSPGDCPRRWPFPPLRSNDRSPMASLRNSRSTPTIPHFTPKWRNLFPLSV
jgi:hypothetical protein